jgi:hypothetical protein
MAYTEMIFYCNLNRSEDARRKPCIIIVSMVKMDFDGVWRDDAKEFQKEIESLGVIC